MQQIMEMGLQMGNESFLIVSELYAMGTNSLCRPLSASPIFNNVWPDKAYAPMLCDSYQLPRIHLQVRKITPGSSPQIHPRR